MAARQGGFTLVELLVSLTILGVILGLLAGGLRVIAKNLDRSAERIDTLDMVSRAADIFMRDTAGLQRVVAIDGDIPRFIFTGTADGLSFVTLEPPYPTVAGPYFVRYSVIANGPHAELVRARAPYQHRMLVFPGATLANRVSLLQGPYRYRFAYSDRTATRGRWLETWPFRNRLPELIRLQIIDPQRDAAIAPSIVAAIAADAELSCLVEKVRVCSPKTGGELKAGSEEARKETTSGKERK
jgi:general secretion pathway protein J